MKNTIVIAVAYLFTTIGLHAQELKTAFVQNHEISVIQDSEPARAITHDGVPKFLPVWSKDGSKIAFVERTDPSQALGRLVVVDAAGTQQSSLLVRPAETAPSSGMRFVESLEWLSDRKIGIGGSINPSQRETVVVDLQTGHETNDIVDDAGGPSFSPDGNHYAYISGMPHFAPQDTWHPELYIDDHLVYPQSKEHWTFVSAPTWSADSKKLAILVENYVSAHVSALVIELPSKITQVLLPVSSDHFDLFTANGDFFIHSTQGNWRIQDDAITSVAKTTELESVSVVKQKLASQQVQVQKLGGTQPDSWCQDCALNIFPRRQELQ